jgi:hypothetical protein
MGLDRFHEGFNAHERGTKHRYHISRHISTQHHGFDANDLFQAAQGAGMKDKKPRKHFGGVLNK